MLQSRTVILNLVLGLSLPWLAGSSHAQEPAKAPTATTKQGAVTDSDLKSFAKAYVQYQQIRKQYEPSLKEAKDAERKKIQDEANDKLRKALAKENLTPENYNRIFSTVNSNEGLRKKALQFIEEERKKS